MGRAVSLGWVIAPERLSTSGRLAIQVNFSSNTGWSRQ